MRKTCAANSASGKLIVFEGPDGAGKSTLARALSDALVADEEPVELHSFPGRNIGSLGRHVYDLHHDPNLFGIELISPEALQALHIAAHLDAIQQTLLPALRAGRTVILDRYWWSTWVYGVDAGADTAILDSLLDVERRSWGTFLPTVVLLISRKDSLRRSDAGETWNRRSELYERLASREQGKYPIQPIVNDRDASTALEQIMNTLEALDNSLNASRS